MSSKTQDRADAQQILDAMQQIQTNPELQAEAVTQPENVLNRLGLSGVARHAVGFAIAAAVVAQGANVGSGVAGAQGIWI